MMLCAFDADLKDRPRGGASTLTFGKKKINSVALMPALPDYP